MVFLWRGRSVVYIFTCSLTPHWQLNWETGLCVLLPLKVWWAVPLVQSLFLREYLLVLWKRAQPSKYAETLVCFCHKGIWCLRAQECREVLWVWWVFPPGCLLMAWETPRCGSVRMAEARWWWLLQVPVFPGVPSAEVADSSMPASWRHCQALLPVLRGVCLPAAGWPWIQLVSEEDLCERNVGSLLGVSRDPWLEQCLRPGPCPWCLPVLQEFSPVPVWFCLLPWWFDFLVQNGHSSSPWTCPVTTELLCEAGYCHQTCSAVLQVLWDCTLSSEVTALHCPSTAGLPSLVEQAPLAAPWQL